MQMQISAHTLIAHTHFPGFCLYVSASDVAFSTSLLFHMYTPIIPSAAA